MTSDSRQSDGPESRHANACRVDLHAHTCFSNKGATRWLDALGIPECCSDPEAVHDLALARGMDLVAITDHNTIAGAWGLIERGFNRVIVGEEISTVLCQTRCPLHILVWSLTPVLHEEIARLGLRDDAEALAGWLRENNLPHALAHPLFDLAGRLTVRTLHSCALLFGGFEIINAGHSTIRHRNAFLRFQESLTPTALEKSSHTLGVKQLWRKHWRTAGSDDHALLNLARAWTTADTTHDEHAFFASLMEGKSRVDGHDATTESLSHQFVGVASAIMRQRADARRKINADCSLDNTTASFSNRSVIVDRLVNRARGAIAECRPLARAMVHARRPTHDSHDDHRTLSLLLREAETESARVLHNTVAKMNTGLGEGLSPQREVLSSLFLQMFSQSPSVVAIRQHCRERRLLRQLEGQKDKYALGDASISLCLFADALDHTSGVSRFVRDVSTHAAKTGKQLIVFTSGARLPDWPGEIRSFNPIGAIPTPGYGSLRLNIPQCSDLLEACAKIDPDVIHVSTPGPVGLVGVLAASILKLPLTGVHHTDFPRYAQQLLGSSAAADFTKQLLRMFYTKFDCVFARSCESANQLAEMGVAAERISTLPAGIDLSRFGADKRDDGVLRAAPRVNPKSVKAIYVGRISQEKNLLTLARIWRRSQKKLDQAGHSAELIVVGDGPWIDAMKYELAGSQAHFLGEQTGETLSRLYASCDFFLFPSTTDTLGQAVIEAQASGLPALVTEIGGPREIVVNHRTGFVLPANDDAAWERAIFELVANATLRRSMSAAAVQHAQQFSFERTAKSFWSEHEALCGVDARESARRVNSLVLP